MPSGQPCRRSACWSMNWATARNRSAAIWTLPSQASPIPAATLRATFRTPCSSRPRLDEIQLVARHCGISPISIPLFTAFFAFASALPLSYHPFRIHQLKLERAMWTIPWRANPKSKTPPPAGSPQRHGQGQIQRVGKLGARRSGGRRGNTVIQ